MHKFNDPVIILTTINSTVGEIEPLTKATIINTFDDGKYQLRGEVKGKIFNIVLEEHLFETDKEELKNL